MAVPNTKFRSKVVHIEAWRWPGVPYDVATVPQWLLDACNKKFEEDGSAVLVGSRLNIRTLEGVMTANPGDWIIRGLLGELYPCKDEVFQKKYEPVE